MSLNQTQFIKIENNAAYSNCIEYENEEGKKIHLIPVLHIGEERYFQDLIKYVGDMKCQYEYIQTVDPEKFGISKDYSINLDYKVLLKMSKNNISYKVNRKSLKNMFKNNLSDELKNMMEFAKEYSNLSTTSQIVFKICKNFFFSIDTLSILQRYLAELLDLKHQSQILEINEIQKWENWEHLDVVIEIDPKKSIELTGDFINEWGKQMYLSLSTYNACLVFEKEPNINLRRKKFIEEIVSVFTLKDNVDQAVDLIPDFIFGIRNKIIDDYLNSDQSESDEFAIFYGTIHMYTIENIIEKLGFKLKAQTKIKALNYVV